MNEKGKENAAFLDSFKPITAFNNIMMNLQSDLEGFNTNLYSSYNKAKENDMPVMRGQTSLPFNWRNGNIRTWLTIRIRYLEKSITLCQTWKRPTMPSMPTVSDTTFIILIRPSFHQVMRNAILR